MLCQPNPWKDNSYGGYLENKNLEISIITGSFSQDHKIENKNLLFKAVNYLNSIKFGVNNLLLDYLTKDGNYLLELIKPNNIIHRDLKPDNILFTNGINNRFVKIADFGLAKVHEKTKLNTKDRGDVRYMAPEVIFSQKYDTKVDIFSLGIIIQEIFLIDFDK